MVHRRAIPNRSPEPGAGPGPDAARPANRLNLLLSYGGWRDESWASRLPQLLQPMGIHAWMAASGTEATYLLRSQRVHLAVVDLALPIDAPAGAEPAPTHNEGGIRLLQLLARLDCPPPTIVVRSPRESRADARLLNQALRQGAFAVVDRPVQLELMLDVFRRVLTRHYQNRWPDQPQ
jgi:CheY-like chemotaxis protein